MYRFALAMTPDDVEAVAAQALCRDAGGGLRRGRRVPLPAPRARRRALRRRRPRWPAASSPRREATGIGLTLLPVFYAHAGFGGAPPRAGAAALHQRSRRLRAAGRRLPRADRRWSVPVGVAPHSLRAVTPDETRRGRRARRRRPIHIHVAEQVKEVDDCLAWSGARPVEWLLDHAACRRALVPRPRDPHGRRARRARAGALAARSPGCARSPRPISATAIFNAAALPRAGGRFGVGTDSNVEIGVAAELRSSNTRSGCASAARNVCAPPGGSTGRALLRGALAGGAQALAAQRRAARRRGRPTSSRLARRPSDACRQGRRLRFSTRGSSRSAIAGRLRLERRTQSGRRRPPLRPRSRSPRALRRRCARLAAVNAAPARRAEGGGPLHRRILADIEARILSGEWPPGWRIPSSTS